MGHLGTGSVRGGSLSQSHPIAPSKLEMGIAAAYIGRVVGRAQFLLQPPSIIIDVVFTHVKPTPAASVPRLPACATRPTEQWAARASCECSA